MPTVFHPGDSHTHQPCGRWPEIQKNPNSPNAPVGLVPLCKVSSPSVLCSFGKARIFFNENAKKHIDWYLTGSGLNFIEDDFLKMVLLNDNGVRSAIGRRLPAQQSGKVADWFKLEQAMYGLEDARTSWGAIDRLDFEADFDAKTLHVWFKDLYTWHPNYPGLYNVCEDKARETNCLHAAFTEMKASGAKDFWMIGEAIVPLAGVPGNTVGGNATW